MASPQNLSEGQWLIGLWAAIVVVLFLGLLMKNTTLVVLAVLGGAGAGFTTFLYVRQAAQPPSQSGHPGDDAESNKGTNP